MASTLPALIRVAGCYRMQSSTRSGSGARAGRSGLPVCDRKRELPCARRSSGCLKRAALGLALTIAWATAVCPRALAETRYIDGVSDQNMAYWGAFFSGGLGMIAPVSFESGWGNLPARVTYARYVAQWNDTGPFQRWLEHVPADVTVDLALTNYHAPESYVKGSADYPSTPQAYYRALQAYLDLAIELDHPIGVVEPWNEPNNQGGYRRASEADHPSLFADEAQRLCLARGCTVVVGDTEDTYGEVGEYLRQYKSGLDFTPRAWGVHPYRAVDDYGDAPSGMSEFEEQCGDCRPWFTEVGAFFCERARQRGVYRGAIWQREHVADLVDRVMPTYRPEHVIYYELKVPGAEAAESPTTCAVGDVTDTALYGANGEPRLAASVIFEL